ncbi:MAG: TonB-dependent receptor [Chitinophagales bacterium]
MPWWIRALTLPVFILFASIPVAAQYAIQLQITDFQSGEPVVGAVVQCTDTGSTLAQLTDTFGMVRFPSVSAGIHNFKSSFIGYFNRKFKVQLPLLKSDEVVRITLEPAQQEMEEVTVVSTRTRIDAGSLPQRVEVISEEEVAERMLDKPSDISHAVKEQPGVQLQRTSASSGMFNIRLQGLRGKYVQVLKDGFPTFGGLSQNISISQIPPLDIRQIEIIKGPASTLYGGDAISGVINLISKEPDEQPVYDVLFSMETTRSIDAAVFASQKVKWFGYSVMAQYRNQQAVDWNVDSFSDIPKLDRWAVAPRFFFDMNRRMKLELGLNYQGEIRKGGAMPALYHRKDTTYDYLELNTTMRYGGHLKWEYDWETKGKLTFRSSVNYFDRALSIYSYGFNGGQWSSVSEFNYQWHNRRHNVVAGVDFRTDCFLERPQAGFVNRSYQYYTTGLFVQEIFSWNEKTSLEAGFRIDYHVQRRVFPLPHASWLQRWNEVVQTRLNIAMGYKLPTIFQDEAEEHNFRNVQAIVDSVKPEWSVGGTMDFKIQVPVKRGWSVSISELVFYTRIWNPLVAVYRVIPEQLSFRSAQGHIQSVGLESSFKVSYRGINVLLGYTLQDQSRVIEKIQSVAPLTSKHIVSMLAGYEMPNRFSVGIDCYYYSPQQLTNGRMTRGIWEMGVVAQVMFKWVNFFANLENLLDIRQSKYGPIVTAAPTFRQPRFAEVYAPLEGRILNVGFKLKLGALVRKKDLH